VGFASAALKAPDVIFKEPKKVEVARFGKTMIDCYRLSSQQRAVARSSNSPQMLK
jgi:hypothetical protein